jgi:hypothetical protein
MMILKTETPQTFYVEVAGWDNISQMAFQNFNFSDPDNEDWATKAASAMETTMNVTAMYLAVDEPTTGINKIPVKVVNNGVRYNLAGQKVDKSYKGIVIENGKKFIQK